MGPVARASSFGKRAAAVSAAALLLACLPGLPSLDMARAGGGSPATCAFQRLDLRAEIGQIIVVSFDGDRPSAGLSDLLRAWPVGGIILFDRNVGSTVGLTALIVGAQQVVAVPLLVAVDQEGGTVVRIRAGVTPLPSERYYGRTRSPARVFADARTEGLALKRLGVNLNLAPVVDVRVAPGSAIGSRSFGPDPTLDATLASAAIRGYQSAGIGATAKHFLGLGEVTLNADLELPVVSATRGQLEANDMPPMRAAVHAGVAAIMVTRVAIPALDPSGTPAYASPVMIQQVIRGELGYAGALITDSLLTPAVFAGPGPAAAAVAALGAGDDMLLVGTGAEQYQSQVVPTIAAIYEAVEQGEVPRSRVDDAAMHVLRLKARLGLLPPCSAGPVRT